MKLTAVRLLVVAAAVIGGATVFSQAEQPYQAQWEKSAHNNTKTSMLESTVEQRQASAAHCGRCHSEQGYLAWLPQQQKGTPGNILGPNGQPATVEYLSSIGLNKAQVRPVTCATCHDAKGGIRVEHETGPLPSGFSATAVGTGAVCMTCHNTRNGRVQWDAVSKGNYTAPHYSAQADVLMGKNFFFVNDTGDTASVHAKYNADSCVSCHKNQAKEPHTFAVSKNACTSCHGLRYGGANVQDPVKFLMSKLRGAILAQFRAAAPNLASIAPYEGGTVKPPIALKIGDIKSLDSIQSSGGQLSFTITTTGGEKYTARIADFRVGMATTDAAAIPNSHALIKASWNYAMLY
ncbi:MAG TPA: hypothetical protein VNT60_04320, partial [Deinococcales bacterium]|nr:hypothetical protein [Deinococcales bacterium]